MVKNLSANARDKKCVFDPWVGTIPWREGMATLQYSCLEKPMDRSLRGLQSIGLQRIGHN